MILRDDINTQKITYYLRSTHSKDRNIVSNFIIRKHSLSQSMFFLSTTW